MTEFWKCGRAFEGETVFLLGGGPTLTDLRLKSIVGRPVVGVNNCLYLGHELVTVLFFGDAKWYWWNRDAVQRGRMFWNVTLNRIAKNNAKTIENEPKLLIMGEGKNGLDARPDHLAWNRSSGACAIDLCVHLGAKTIVLCGYDMRRVNNKKNWMPHAQEKTNQNPYEYMLGTLQTIEDASKKIGVKILNATPGSAITCFEKIDYSEAVKL